MKEVEKRDSFSLVQIKEFASIGQGYTFSPLYQGKAQGRWPWAKVADMQTEDNSIWIKEASNYVDDDLLKHLGLRPFPAGSIVFPRVGAALRSNKKRILAQPMLVDDNVLVVTVIHPEICDPLYLYHWFSSISLDRCFANGGQVPSIPGHHVLSYAVPLPLHKTQVSIAYILSIWDQAIEQTERLIAAKRRRKQALMQQLLTGKRRLPEFLGSRAVQTTKYGKVPADWRYLAVRDIAAEVSERNSGHADLPVISCTKYDGLVPSLEYFGKRVFSEDTSNYKVVRRNQFAYPCNHVEEGSIGILDFLDAGIVSPIYTVFQADPNVHPPFLYALFKTEMYRHIFAVSTSASVDRRGSLRWSDFSQIKVALPSLPEQRHIAEVLSTCDEELRRLDAQLDALKRQKKGLMQQLLTGKVRVPTQEEETR